MKAAGGRAWANGHANAAPELFELSREDAISIDQMVAVCSTPDRLRRMVTEGEVDARHDPRVGFVGGVLVYEAAGDTIRADLVAQGG